MNRFAKLVSVAAISSSILVSAQDIDPDPTISDVVPEPDETTIVEPETTTEPTVVVPEEDQTENLEEEVESSEKLETETLEEDEEDGTDNATT